jgi:hypothetical protein
MQVVQLASIDNYVLETNNLFSLIREATLPGEFINVNLPTLSETRSTKTEMIEEIFVEMRYL